jgi:hypothetical protein
MGMSTGFALEGCDLDLQPYVDPGKDGGGLVDVGFDGNNNNGATDGRVDDDGGGAIIDAPISSDAPGDAPANVKRVFATATPTNGNLGGLAGADTRCQQAAAAGNMNGTFIAWLSVNNTPAVGRLTSNGPWFLPDKQTRVFASKAAITTIGPETPIEFDEKGVKIQGGADVWTGTGANGNPSPQNCANFGAVLGQGLSGETDQKTVLWTQSANNACTAAQRLYCFEQ